VRGHIVPVIGKGMHLEGEVDELNEGCNCIDVGEVNKLCNVLLHKAHYG